MRPCLEVLEGRDLPAPIVTAWDTIPNYADNPTIQVAQSGSWSATSTWNLGRVPVAGDRVVCGAYSVTYDVVSDAALESLALTSGCLLYVSRATPTRLTVGTFQVQTGAWADWGSGTSIVTASAEIVFTDTIPADANQFGTGLIVLGSFSSLGVSRQPWSQLATAPAMGNTTLSLTAAPTGWAPGDKLVIPDTRASQPTWQGELPTVLSVSGTTVTLTAPLSYDHLPPAGLAVHVGNLTRNVVLRSANPNGVRGHTFFTDRANVFSFYTEFRDLGRTTTASISPTNPVGRYPIHFHHIMGSYPTISTHQYMLVGASVWQQNATARWAVTVHDSHYGLVQGNTVHNSTGWGIGTETGGETANELTWNFVVRTTGRGSISAEPGNGGGSFWFAGPKNYVAGNVAADARNTEFDLSVGGIAGFDYFSQGVGDERIPNFRGASTAIVGEWHLENMQITHIAMFDSNTAYGTPSGLGYWWTNFDGVNPELSSGGTVSNFTAWNVVTGVVPYFASGVTVDGLTLRGPGSLQGTGFFSYAAFNNTVRNFDVRGFGVGVSSGEYQKTNERYENGVLQNALNFQVTPRENTAGEFARMPTQESTITIDDVQFIGPALQMKYPAVDLLHNLAARDDVYLTNFNRVAGNNYRAHYREQRPDFVVPVTFYTDPSGPFRRVGSPVSGLTNQQNWDAWEWRFHPTTRAYESRSATGDPGWRRVAIAGSIAPAAAVDGAFIGVDGLVQSL